MGTHLKKLLALLLCLATVLGTVPAVVLSEGLPRFSGAVGVWERINEYQEKHFRQKRALKQAVTYEDYCAIAGDIAQIVKESDDVVEGSCTYDPDSGNATFFWDGKDGESYGYSPSLAAKMNGRILVDPETVDVSETISYATAESSQTSFPKDVYVIGPWYGSDNSFTNQYKDEGQHIAEVTGGTYTLYSSSSATVDKVAEAIQNGAVVFFDSHGLTDYDKEMPYKDDGYEVYDDVTKANTSYLILTTGKGWTDADRATATGTYGQYKHAWSFTDTEGYQCYCVDGTVIANHMTQNAPGNFIWSAICLGMATEGLAAPLRDRGVDVFYGYSQSVTFSGDYQWSSEFWEKMAAGETVATAFDSMKQYGKWDMDDLEGHETIGRARYYMCAFPNVISDEDAYQGQRTVNPASVNAANSQTYDPAYGACNIQTVHSTWTLFGKYKVTATVRNPEYGTVSVSGTSIAANPVEGYTVAEANVVSGSATVRISGKTVLVIPSSDCTVEVVFGPKKPVTLSYFANGSMDSQESGYAGDEILLPTTVMDVPDWTFVGWSVDPIAQTSEKPVFLKPGEAFVPEDDTVFYAVYMKREGATGSGDWLLLLNTEDMVPGLKIVFASSEEETVAGGLNNTYLVSLDCDAFEDETITELPAGAEIFTLDGSPEGWTFTSASGQLYCSDLKKLNFNSQGSGVWTVELDEGYAYPRCENDSYGTLQYNHSSPRYTTYISSLTPVEIYYMDGSAGTAVYTTSPVVCLHEFLTPTAETDPTCGKDGNIAYWTCDSCGMLFADANAETMIKKADTVLPATGLHTFGAFASNNNGTHTHVCSVCGTEETESCACDSVVTEPTETEQGYTTHTCNVCGYSFTDSYTDPLGPTYTVSFAVPAGSGLTAPADMGCNRTGITLPAAPDFTLGGVDYVFAGWVTEPVEQSDTLPASVLTGKYVATADCTLTALYAYQTENEGGGKPALTEVTAVSDIADGDEIVITALGLPLGLYQQTSGTSYVSNFDFGTDLTADLVAGDALTHLTFTAFGDYWTIGDSTDGYLYSSGSNNLIVTPTNKTAFALGKTANGFTLISTDARYLSCRTDLTSANQNLWRLGGTNASTGTSTLTLYKYVPATPFVTVYTTAVPCPHANAEEVPAAEPTCGKAGNSAYWHCPDCEKLFSDAACTEEIDIESTVIPATGNHTYGAYVPDFAGHHSRTCTVCGDVLTEDCDCTVVTTATYTSEGEYIHTCNVCGGSYSGGVSPRLGSVSEYVRVSELRDGDLVVLYNPNAHQALTSVQSGTGLAGTEAVACGRKLTVESDLAVWTVVKNPDGTCSFKQGSKGLIVNGEGNVLSVASQTPENWTVELISDYADTFKLSSANGFLTWTDGRFVLTAAADPEGSVLQVHVLNRLASVVGQSLTAGGEIGINIYLDLPFSFIAMSNAPYVCLYDGETLIERIHADGLDLTENGYRLSLTKPAKEIQDVITLKLFDDGTPVRFLVNGAEAESLDFSVQNYLDTVIRAEKDAYPEKLVKLCKAMSDYGSCAMVQQGYHAENARPLYFESELEALTSASAGLAGETELISVPDSSPIEGLSYYGASLVMENNMAIRVYFLYKGEKELTCNGKALEANGDLLYAEVSGISATDFDESQSVTVSDGTNTYTVSGYSVHTYIRKQLLRSETKGEDASAELIAVVRAIAWYGMLAEEYFS